MIFLFLLFLRENEKTPETLDFTGKIYKKAFVSVYHILSFARGVKISLWGKDWGKIWGMKNVSDKITAKI